MNEAFENWFSREDYGDREQLQRAWQEARAAAFREAIQIAKEEAFERRLAHTVYERLIEAAANSEPEDGEGS